MPIEPGETSAAGVSRALGMARGSLAMGTALLTALLTANIASYMMPEEGERLALKYEPPHPDLLRALLKRDVATDSMDRALSLFGEPDEGRGDSAVFTTTPRAVARVGARYTYDPRATLRLTDFSLRCDRVDESRGAGSDGAASQQCEAYGFAVDRATGLVTGTPNTVGRYNMAVEAQVDAERRVHHRFTLFVDDRLLLLGADMYGRDLFRRLVLAARYTILPGLIAILIGVGAGVVVGALGGFFGGPLRQGLRAATTVIQSVPGLLVIFLAASISGFNGFIVMAVVGVILLPETANGVLERVEHFRKRDFVEAARELGMRDRTILWNEIVWHNTRSFILTRITNGLSFAILVEVTLSYMGLTDHNSTSLGNMLLDGRRAWVAQASTVPALAALAGLLTVVATFSLLERGILGLWERRR